MTRDTYIAEIRRWPLGKSYEIDELGRVYSKARKGTKGGRMKIWKDGNGYSCVRTYENAKHKIYKIHILLARKLIPNPKNLPQINHIDGNPSNNALSNLEWCTGRENLRHAYRIGLRKEVSSSGEKYIYKYPRDKTFKVTITNLDGTKTHVGRYTNIKKAKEARDLHLKCCV